MRRFILMTICLVLMVVVSNVSATQVDTDDFNRATLGSNWSGDTSWSIVGSDYAYRNASGTAANTYQPLTIEAGSYAQVDFYIETVGNYNWCSVGTFHDDGAGSYYYVAMRINNQGGPSPWYLHKVTAGVDSQLVAGSVTYQLNSDKWLTLRFETDNAGTVTAKLQNKGDSSWWTASVTDASPLTDGRAGLLCDNEPMRFDNFEMQGVPEPATIGLLVLGFGLLRKR